MNLEIINYSNDKLSTEYLEIEKMRNKFEPENLLLVKEFDMDENGHKISNIEIKKVQFIASCKTRLENEILVAFYIHDEGYFETHIISDLPGQYVSNQGYLVDYKSYCDICELTKEQKLSFLDYFEQVKKGYVGKNTFAKFQDKFYNYTEQKVMWDLVAK